MFVARIRDWEKTIRKRGGIVGFATQSASDALQSRIASAIIEQAGTQIFMANAGAQASDYVGGFGLTDQEYEIIRSMPESAHAFLVKHGTDSVVVRLNLTSEPALLTVLSGRESTVRLLDRIRDEVGDSPAQWLPPLARRRMSPDLCSAAPTTGLVASLLATTDCQASRSRRAWLWCAVEPGAATAAMLTSLMVIAVALYGYRLLLGRGLVLGEVVGLAIRLGVVLLLAASWSSFQALAYDAVARAPSRIASDLVVAIDAPAPLQGVQSALDRIEQLNVGWQTRAGIASPLVGGAPTAAMTLNVSSFLLMVSTLGLLVVSRILLSLLLAITPLVAGFLLFDATRGLLEGWLRALTTAAVIPLFVVILSAVELSILAPLLDQMIGQQARGQFEVDDVTPVGLVILVFSLAIFASARAAATIAGGIRLARFARPPGASAAAWPQSVIVGDLPLPLTGSATVASPIVRALEAAARRDSNAGEMRAAIAAPGGSRASVLSGVASDRRGGGDLLFSPANSLRLAPARARFARASRAAARRDA